MNSRNLIEEDLMKCLGLAPRFHFTSESGELLGERGITILVKRLCEKAHITGGHVCHRLRHPFAIELLRAGGDVMSLQYLLVHSSLEMVKRYLGSLNADDAARAHKKFSPMTGQNSGRYR